MSTFKAQPLYAFMLCCMCEGGEPRMAGVSTTFLGYRILLTRNQWQAVLGRLAKGQIGESDPRRRPGGGRGDELRSFDLLRALHGAALRVSHVRAKSLVRIVSFEQAAAEFQNGWLPCVPLKSSGSLMNSVCFVI